jgi:hypothetical protein
MIYQKSNNDSYFKKINVTLRIFLNYSSLDERINKLNCLITRLIVPFIEILNANYCFLIYSILFTAVLKVPDFFLLQLFI